MLLIYNGVDMRLYTVDDRLDAEYLDGYYDKRTPFQKHMDDCFWGSDTLMRMGEVHERLEGKCQTCGTLEF